MPYENLRIRNIFCKFAVQKKNPMIRKIVILFAVSLWAATSFAQQDTIVTPRPEELTVDSISSDSVSNQDTIYIVQHGHHHGKKAHFKGYESMHKKAVKRRHKVQKQKAQQKRHERMVNAHKRAQARTSAHHSSSHSSHSGSHHSGSHRSGHSRGRR